MKSINKTARLSGFLYLIMAPFAMFGMMYISSLIVPGDVAKTANNIMASESLYRLSILSALLVQVGHIFLVLLLYKLLKPVNKNCAVLMVIFMLVGVPITMLNELNRLVVLLLLGGANHLAVNTSEQLQALVPLFLDFHEHGVFIVQIFWGLWLFPMGYLVFKSGYLPKFLGILLIIAGISYLIDFSTVIAFPSSRETISVFTSIGVYGEIIFPLWLLIKGVNLEKWEKLTLESA